MAAAGVVAVAVIRKHGRAGAGAHGHPEAHGHRDRARHVGDSLGAVTAAPMIVQPQATATSVIAAPVPATPAIAENQAPVGRTSERGVAHVVGCGVSNPKAANEFTDARREHRATGH